jgi:hypothetical protein
VTLLGLVFMAAEGVQWTEVWKAQDSGLVADDHSE